MADKWWQNAVGYQIYPKSFFDSNGDGVGDLNGIRQKVAYLQALGIDFVWLCPVYRSPGIDNGYDISDYQDIDPQYGTMSEMDLLIDELHQHHIRIVMDLVLNHTSDQHKWFKAARKSTDNQYHDYYIWKKGRSGSTPNNWTSLFGGSAWQYNPATDEYYYHLYAKQQPDLNWENPKLRNEIHEMIKFWIRKGVDGFRLDAITHLKKLQTFEDVDNPDQASRNIPGIDVFLNELKKIYDHYGIMTVGEVGAVPPKEAIKWVSPDDGYMSMLFQFDHVNFGDSHKFDFGTKSIKHVKDALNEWQKASAAANGTLGLFVENHDLPRAVSYFGSEELEYRERSAKAIGLMYFMMKGTSYIYQGQEIGMMNDHIRSIHQVNDVDSIRFYDEQLAAGNNSQLALQRVAFKGRDNARTPMQWSDKQHAGFSTKGSWIKMSDSYQEINVAAQQAAPKSVLNFYKKMISIKKSDRTLQNGEFKLETTDNANLIAYRRIGQQSSWLVLANLSNNEISYGIPTDLINKRFEVVLSNIDGLEVNGTVKLAPWAAVLIRFN